jgi:alpha-L-fucosidase
MSRKVLLALLGGVLLIPAGARAQTSPTPAVAYAMAAARMVETGAVHDARIAWWREAKFGMFIHWGLYAIPAGEWEGKQIPGNAEGIMTRAKIPVEVYEKFAAQFNPVKFNADEWVQLAVDAGMKYLVFVAKHHDGFAMFDSKVHPYTIVNRTPWKRDPARELSEACARKGIRFCVYYSHNLDWHDPHATASRDLGPGSARDFSKHMYEKALPQIRELLANYGPIGIVWFDMSGGMTREQAQPFYDLVRHMQPGCLINSRISKALVPSDYLSKGDHSIPDRVTPGDWETPDTMNDSWGFKHYDRNWKTADKVVFDLVDIVAKGGNYLLNVGPTAEGVIPSPCPEALREVGRWLKVNGESIYGAGPTPFGPELGAEHPTDQDPKTGAPVFVPDRAWRCTAKPGRLYLHLFQWPAGPFALPGVPGRVTRAYLLSDPQRAALTFTQAGDALSLVLPAQAPDPLGTVVCLVMSDDAR